MLEQITFEFTPALEEKGLFWELSIAPDVELLCDPDKLMRVFDNLLKNAVNYSYPNTAVCVSPVSYTHLYIKKHDFKVFGWYRIVLGAVVLLYFYVIK